MDSIETLIIKRRTINDFKQELPAQQSIIDAINIARWAPNHHLTQPWHFYLLNSQMVDQVIELNASLVSAKKGKKYGDAKRERWKSIPGWLVVTCDKSDNALRQQEDYAACCCSIYGLTLVLWQKGIGTKWTSGDVIRDRRFYDICWLDHLSQFVVGLIWYGYPDTVPEAQARRQINETVTIY